MAKPLPDQEGFSAPVFKRRLMYYLVGLAIGFVMLGLLQKMKSDAAKARQQQQQNAPASP
ncbi:MAG: hypothetical protein ACOYN0_15085 [Phycisphaerales bacterium]